MGSLNLGASSTLIHINNLSTESGQPHPAIVRYASEAVRRADVQTSVARIRALATSPKEMIRGDVALALGHFRGAESELVLRRLIDDPDAHVRGCALEGYRLFSSTGMAA